PMAVALTRSLWETSARAPTAVLLPDGQVPVIRSWTSPELTSTAPMVPSRMCADVTPPGAMLIVPDVVIGPPARPDPVPTLRTVPPLLVSVWQPTVPSISIALIELAAGQLPVTRFWRWLV